MILTEKEAKEKLCVDFASAYSEVMGLLCKGSRCMAWKWHQDYKDHGCCGKVYPTLIYTKGK